MDNFRQKLLVLYLGNSTPDSHVIGWSIYDGTGEETFEATGNSEPPYKTGLCAMKDGWRLIKFPELKSPVKGQEFDLGYLEHEFVFEKWINMEVAKC